MTPQDPSPEWQPPEPERPRPYEGTYGGVRPPAPGGAVPPGPYPQQGPYAPHGPELASRWARLGASLLDGLIVGAVSAPFLIQAIRWNELDEIAQSGRSTSPLDAYDIPRLIAGYAVALVLGFAYFTIQHARSGQTVGKRAAGIRVVRADDNGAITWRQAVLRQVVVYLFNAVAGVANFVFPLISLVGVLDPAWILWDPRRQSLHDKAAGTLVLKVDHRAPNPYRRD
ncbi:RDD family protein [Spirillospora sp. NPDC048911]|uniref:RDD family protein n=1 Tax=Spirillospora sp. NPDC048911 TaxID=3364527 RepID=UPI003716E091